MKSAIRRLTLFLLVALLAPERATLGQTSGGAIVAWGFDYYGQCTVPAPNTDFTAVAGGSQHSLGLRNDGAIVAWGYNELGQCTVPAPNTNFTAVAAGEVYSLGLKSDASIVAWGWNYYGQCTVPIPNTGFTAVAAGWGHSLGVKTDGSVVAWGYSDAGQCTVPLPNMGFVAVAAGFNHSLGLKSDGSIVAWGSNEFGECTVPTPNVGFRAVGAGSSHSLGLKIDGSVVAWGDNRYGQCTVPMPNMGFMAVAAGSYCSLGLKTDGSIIAWGRNEAGQCDTPWPNVGFTAVAAGGAHSLGIRCEPPVSSGDLLVDFGATGEIGLQPGYQPFERPEEDTAASATDVFWTPLGNDGFVTVAVFATSTKPDAPRLNWRDRDGISGGPFLGSRDLLSDFVKADTESRLGGFETLHLQFATLLGGRYQLTTYHHDTSFNTGDLNVYVEDARGTTRVATSLSQTTGTNPSSVASLQFELYADNVNPVTIRFEEVDGTADNEEADLNGFDLIPLPAWGLKTSDGPNDQGGQLVMSWPRHDFDALAAPAPVTGYDVQRYNTGWQTLTTVAAAQADSYSVDVATSDILTIGQPAPYSQYRVVARTANPLIFYESLPDSGYSIDNLPPEAPPLTLYEGETFRSVAWQNPAIPDFKESCLYRGTEPGFVEGDPLVCSASQFWYQENHLALYYYRARSYDIHGNASEWSNEVVGQYPTDVPAAPTTLRLYPNQPNPFNPRTTLRFDLPEAGRVRVAVYDVRGKLIRELVDAELPVGSHSAVWDGKDSAGRAMASGGYFAMLKAGGRMETVRMGLVK